MAGKDDKAKKRKRDAIEASAAKSKRQRSEKEKERSQKAQQNGKSLTNGSGGRSAVAASGEARELEIKRDFENGEAGWRLSKPMGGRMLDIDPILTQDERHLIIAYNTSVQVYSASDSLLIRRIPITTVQEPANKGVRAATVTAVRLSIQDSNYIWVACSNGQIHRVDWTRAPTAFESISTTTGTAKDLTVVPSPAGGPDALLVLEASASQKTEVNAYHGSSTTSGAAQTIQLKEPIHGLSFLAANTYGRVLVGALNDRLFISAFKWQEGEALSDVTFETFSYKIPDPITCLDVRVDERRGKDKKSNAAADVVVDIVVGGARGAIYLYSDVLLHLQNSDQKALKKDALQARKYHWHRKAVHAVKWSRDGNYMISGGSENTLVIWQLDTAQMSFLPHLSASVENIAVSPVGSSYAVHLDDNSTMVLSTAELKPTAYVSGIQSATAATLIPKDLVVKRTWSAPTAVKRPIPAAINPADPSRLHLCVGSGQQATPNGDFPAPLLQTFDLDSFTSVSKQPLTRTNATEINATKNGTPISEPLLSHISYSHDGKWLASVDEWQPSMADSDNTLGDMKEHFAKDRLEVYLKFWQVAEDGSLALVSRINTPHSTTSPERVLSLAASPAAMSYATLGADSKLRLWTSRTQKKGNVVAATDAVTWHCSKVISLGDAISDDVMIESNDTTPAPEAQKGCVQFSEDGSTLFAAYGTAENGAVHVIDVASGDIVDSMEGLWKGQLRAIGVISPFLIVLSDELRVYDIVGDELRYAIKMPEVKGAKDLLSLAVDQTTGHFAVSLPLGETSSIGVFDPEDPEPLLVRSTPQLVVSLLSGPTSSGFIAVDDAAQISIVAEGSDPSSLSTVQPLEDLRLEEGDVAPEAESKDFSLVLNDDAMSDAGEDGAEEDIAMGGIDADDETRARVIPHEALSEIFDAAPNYQAATVEDLFYKVIALTQQSR